MSNALLSPQDLQEKQSSLRDIVILDATYGTPDAHGGYMGCHIAGARFFDVETIADPNAPYPHTLPPADDFAAAAGALGIGNDTTVVIYDQTGIAFAAARAWWMFRAFGHENVLVLNGGLPAWIAAGFATETGNVPAPAPKPFKADFQPDLYRSFEDVEQISEQGGEQIVDARGAARFNAPARTLDGDVIQGHIPGSTNLPFAALLDHAGNMKTPDEIGEILKAGGVDSGKKQIVSCGSGITACVLALGFFQTGIKNTAVFDGSWTEWSDRQSLS